MARVHTPTKSVGNRWRKISKNVANETQEHEGRRRFGYFSGVISQTNGPIQLPAM